jgi:hypothetical protein
MYTGDRDKGGLIIDVRSCPRFFKIFYGRNHWKIFHGSNEKHFS